MIRLSVLSVKKRPMKGSMDATVRDSAQISNFPTMITDGSAGCGMTAHGRCAEQICLVCPIAFHPEKIQAAFVRCFASLFYTYRKYLYPAMGDQKAAGKIYRFNMDGFLKSIPRESATYVQMLQQTQSELYF